MGIVYVHHIHRPTTQACFQGFFLLIWILCTI